MTADQLGAFLPIVVIVLAFWFLIIRPARRRQQQAQKLQSQIAVGEQVMLTSGIFGLVVGVDDETLELEIAPGVVVKALRPAVAKVVEPAYEADEAAGADAADEAAEEVEPAEADEAHRRSAAERTDGRDAPA